MDGETFAKTPLVSQIVEVYDQKLTGERGIHLSFETFNR